MILTKKRVQLNLRHIFEFHSNYSVFLNVFIFLNLSKWKLSNYSVLRKQLKSKQIIWKSLILIHLEIKVISKLFMNHNISSQNLVIFNFLYFAMIEFQSIIYVNSIIGFLISNKINISYDKWECKRSPWGKQKAKLILWRIEFKEL